MKLSNKILLGFFGFAFLYLTAAFAEIRFKGTPNTINGKNSKAETADVSGIKYIIVDNVGREVIVAGSDRTQLEVRSFGGDMLKKLTYSVSGDTLKLSRFESDDSRNIKITVFVPKSTLKGVSVKSCPVFIEELQQDRLNISQDAGRVWMSGSIIATIEADLSNKSLLDISGTVVDTASVSIDQSQIFISSPAGLVKGSMKNKSLMHLNEVQEIQLKKDGDSKLTIYH
jgi:hypothetical protein